MTAAPSILIVTTSHDRLGDTGERTGLWLEELAAPYWAFVDAGLQVTLASPKGGAIPVDPRSREQDGANAPVVERFLDDPGAREAAANTRPLADVNADGFDAVFLPGGHGTMWDLPGDARLAALLGAVWEAGGVVAAVCHGPAGLLGARDAEGRPLLQGRRVTGFTNSEERAAGLDAVVPFLLEDRMRELGGRFEQVDDFQPFAVADGRLVTGQNPASSGDVAERVIERLRARRAA